MNARENSINQNGCSVCKAGKENYTTFSPVHRPNNVFYQYDYHHKDGELYSTVAPTLEGCRAKRDKWLQEKHRKRFFLSTLQKIENGKCLTKSEMAYQIGNVEPLHVVAISWDFFTREEIVETFNQMFGTEIK